MTQPEPLNVRVDLWWPPKSLAKILYEIYSDEAPDLVPWESVSDSTRCEWEDDARAVIGSLFAERPQR